MPHDPGDDWIHRDVLSRAIPGKHGDGIREEYRRLGILGPSAIRDNGARETSLERVSDGQLHGNRWVRHRPAAFDRRETITVPVRKPGPTIQLRHQGSVDLLFEVVRALCGETAVLVFQMRDEGIPIIDQVARLNASNPVKPWSIRTLERRLARWQVVLADHLEVHRGREQSVESGVPTSDSRLPQPRLLSERSAMPEGPSPEVATK